MRTIRLRGIVTHTDQSEERFQKAAQLHSAV